MNWRSSPKLEIDELSSRKAELEDAIRIRLLPKDPNDDKNIFLEIRAGTGGDEAALFVADLFRMYSRYAETKGWKVEIMSSQSHRHRRFQGDYCPVSAATASIQD